jgi:hypothetical protein
MWLLTIEDDEGSVTHRRLTGERCTLGRAPDRDVVLAQFDVSRRHARLERRGDGWQVVDDGSANGTFLNGRRVWGSAPVGARDAIQLGGYRLALSSAPPAGVRTPAPRHMMPARVRAIAGPSAGDEYTFERYDLVTIGAADQCSLRVLHERVAVLHAVIRPLPEGRYGLVDRSPERSVLVNGRAFQGEHVLGDGDVIGIAGVALVRFLEPSELPAPRVDLLAGEGPSPGGGAAIPGAPRVPALGLDAVAAAEGDWPPRVFVPGPAPTEPDPLAQTDEFEVGLPDQRIEIVEPRPTPPRRPEPASFHRLLAATMPLGWARADEAPPGEAGGGRRGAPEGGEGGEPAGDGGDDERRGHEGEAGDGSDAGDAGDAADAADAGDVEGGAASIGRRRRVPHGLRTLAH